MKTLTSIFIVSLTASLFVFVGGAMTASAEGYVPLVTLPGVTEVNKSVNMSEYLSGVIKLLIAVGAGLAVLTFIVAGVMYVMAGISPSARSEANKKMTDSAIGLALILASYLILNSINPKLVQFNLMLPPVSISPSQQVSAGPTEPTAPVAVGGDWGDDSTIRNKLANANIGFNRQNCAKEGDKRTRCTSVTQLGGSAVNGLMQLKSSCNCSVTVTGGTEYWFHSKNTAHQKGNSVVDIGTNGKLNEYIRKGTSARNARCGPTLAFKYRVNGAVYADEGDHWHVCY